MYIYIYVYIYVYIFANIYMHIYSYIYVFFLGVTTKDNIKICKCIYLSIKYIMQLYNHKP